MRKIPITFVHRPAKAFTLVELMVVIAIILVLMAASVGVVFKFLSSQKQAATQRTVDQVNSAIERVLKNIRTRAHTDFASTPLKSLASLIGTNLMTSPNNYIGIREPARRDEMVYVNFQIARAFPLNFNAIGASKITTAFVPLVNPASSNGINQSFNVPIAGVVPANSNLAVIPSIFQASKSISGTPSAEIQNSACLLMALEANPDGLKGENLGSAIMTDTATGARYLATGDGQPIGFQLRYLDSASGGSKSVVGTVTVELIVP